MASRGGFESDPSRVVAGHKAATKNPNVSDEAKEHSAQIVEEMEEHPEDIHYPMKEEKDDMRVNAGYKATMKSKCLDWF
ncbi:hypothetical protein OE88DRAFT_1662042 [Heliocybe sulcata]|uniref:Conidiation protein 6 n=1 Tax=Heliocybe sulcata TaxID=5364 RepID=A0A5C3MW36_9AGAM|nr:hypothetical protein OE88DRAFT_1662042 [Heliocybe sulcata]